MNTLSKKNYFFYFIILGIIFHLITTYFSIGFYSDDEHFQILEPTAYLLGLNEIIINDDSGYYWEWYSHSRIRPWIQPYVYYKIIIFIKQFGINDPFIWTYILRLVSSIIGIASIVYLFFTLKKEFLVTKTFFNYLLLFSFWFYPFLNSRTSSESIGISFFIIGFCFLYKNLLTKNNFKDIIILFFISFLLGLSLVVKFILVFAFFPIGFWLLFNSKKLINFITIFIGTTLALLFGLFIDYINWGSFKNTYWQFYEYNLGRYDRLDGFGVEPWYYYILETVISLAPILSLFFVISFFIFCIKNPNNIISWICLCTLIPLSFIGHKEIRYIFIVYYFAPFFIIYFFQKYQNVKFQRFYKACIIISNFIFLLLIMFSPANTKVGVYKYLFYNHTIGEKVYYTNTNPYLVNNMEPFFYTKFLPKIEVWEQNNDNIKDNYWVVTNNYEEYFAFAKKNNCKKEFSNYPEKIFNLNNNWKRLKLNWYLIYCKNN